MKHALVAAPLLALAGLGIGGRFHQHQQVATLTQAGTVQLSPPSSGLATSDVITFGTPYSSPPVVMVQVRDSLNPWGALEFGPVHVTNTGFQVLEGPANPAAIPAGGFTVQWEAVGQ